MRICWQLVSKKCAENAYTCTTFVRIAKKKIVRNTEPIDCAHISYIVRERDSKRQSVVSVVICIGETVSRFYKQPNRMRCSQTTLEMLLLDIWIEYGFHEHEQDIAHSFHYTSEKYNVSFSKVNRAYEELILQTEISIFFEKKKSDMMRIRLGWHIVRSLINWTRNFFFIFCLFLEMSGKIFVLDK